MFDRPVCQKRSFKAGKSGGDGGGANHILQGLHRLCEVLARLSFYTESDDGTGAADIQISIRSNEDFSNETMMSSVKIHRLNFHVFNVFGFFLTAVETTANLENLS